MASKSSKAFSLWRKRMNFTYRETAKNLGICVASVGFYSVGTRKDNKEDEGKSVEVPKVVLLACSAVENKLPPIQ